MEWFDRVEDAQTRQAQVFLGHLLAEIAELSRSIEHGEDRTHPVRSCALRAELYEAHRQVDQLCRRFPVVAEQFRRSSRELLV
ncbi:hypothetical protein [Rhodococcus sp. NPDC057529]|uniref:hypothetical protein n=1 Tax=Rhodococcus sp. NPDC057529 TaxID=3346158 RepID=UPI00366AB60F